jgi:hypothetical protein
MDKVTYKQLTAEQIEKTIKDIFKDYKPPTKMTMFCGKGWFKYVYDEQGKDALILFLQEVDVMTGAEGMEYLQEVLPEYFKKTKNDNG